MCYDLAQPHSNSLAIQLRACHSQLAETWFSAGDVTDKLIARCSSVGLGFRLFLHALLCWLVVPTSPAFYGLWSLKLAVVGCKWVS